MHSGYQTHSTHYANLAINNVHAMIDDLCRRARKLAPRYAEETLAAGNTNERSSQPRQAKAWDMIAEAHAWNSIADKPDLVNHARQLDLEGRWYTLEWNWEGGFDTRIYVKEM